MTKRPCSVSTSRSELKRPRREEPIESPSAFEQGGVDTPDDIAELWSNYMDGGSGASFSDDGVDLAPNHRSGALKRKKEKIKRLKAEKKVLRRDLARSRRAGRELESNMARLCRQRQKELSNGRRAARSIQTREQAVASRERACTRLQSGLAEKELCVEASRRSYEQNEVVATVRDLVKDVELLASESATQSLQEDLKWLSTLEKDSRERAAWMERDWREADTLIAVEQQLLQERVVAMSCELEETRKQLGDKIQAETELEASREALQQEVISKTGWLTGLALGNMALVSSQTAEARTMEAERGKWRRSLEQLQRKYDEAGAEQSKLHAENMQLRQQLRADRKPPVNKKQGKKAKRRQKPSQLEQLEDSFDAAKSEANEPFTEEPERLRTLRGNVRKR